MYCIVEFLLEDGLTMVVHHEEASEKVVLVNDHKEVALALGNHLRVFAQGAVDGDGQDVGVDGLVPVQLAQRVLVFVVGAEVVLLGERLRIDGVFLERVDAEVGAGCRYHQGDEQCVTR